MLLTIAVFASVGAALAFKVKTVGSKKFCYLVTDDQPAAGRCTEGIESAFINVSSTGITFFLL